MGWIRRRWARGNRADTAACSAVGLGVVLLLWVLVPLAIPEGDAADDPSTADPLTSQPGLDAPYSSGDDLPAPDTDTDRADADASVSDRVQQGIATFGAGGSAAGLSGDGGVRNQPRHTLTISFASEAPLGTIGYIIPTSLRDNYGVSKDTGRSFSLTTTVYGDPDYAQGFARAGQRGFPVTCTITVDGRVTERQATEGPYGQLFCQG